MAARAHENAEVTASETKVFCPQEQFSLSPAPSFPVCSLTLFWKDLPRKKMVICPSFSSAGSFAEPVNRGPKRGYLHSIEKGVAFLLRTEKGPCGD